MKKSKVKKQDPKVVIVIGGLSAGKTNYIKNEFAKNYTIIDAGAIFIELSEGKYYDFPSHLESKMNEVGLKKLKTAIGKKENIVVEVIGDKLELLKELIELVKKINYKSSIVNLTCDIEEAIRRNKSRDDDSISAYYCESYHLNWFKQVASENKSKSSKLDAVKKKLTS